MRVLIFASVYFFIYTASAILFMTGSLSSSSEFGWYLENPWGVLQTILGFVLVELPRNPLLMFSLFALVLQSFVLGFATEWGLRFLLRYVQLRRGAKKR